MSSPLTNDDRLEMALKQMDNSLLKMQHIFEEYNRLFSQDRDLEVRKLVNKYLLEIDPDNEEYLIEKYALEGRDYLAEKIATEKLRIEKEAAERKRKEEREERERIWILEVQEKERVRREEFEEKRKKILEKLQGKSPAAQAELEKALQKLQDGIPISDEEMQRRKSLWEAKNKNNPNPRWGSRMWFIEDN